MIGTMQKLKKPAKHNQASAVALDTFSVPKEQAQRTQANPVLLPFRAPAPGLYPPAAIKKLRLDMCMSQATFAKVVGVSRILVLSWERGVRTPSTMACRLLDTISADPQAWLANLKPEPASTPSTDSIF